MTHPKGRNCSSGWWGSATWWSNRSRAETMRNWGLGYEVLSRSSPTSSIFSNRDGATKGPISSSVVRPDRAGDLRADRAVGAARLRIRPPDGAIPTWTGAERTTARSRCCWRFTTRSAPARDSTSTARKSNPAIYMTGTAILDYRRQRPPLAAHRQPLAVPAGGAARRLSMRGDRSLDRDRGHQ